MNDHHIKAEESETVWKLPEICSHASAEPTFYGL